MVDGYQLSPFRPRLNELLEPHLYDALPLKVRATMPELPDGFGIPTQSVSSLTTTYDERSNADDSDGSVKWEDS